MVVTVVSFELHESTNFFPDLLFDPLQCVLGPATMCKSINVKLFELPQCFICKIIPECGASLRVLSRAYSHCGDSNSCLQFNDTKLSNLWLFVTTHLSFETENFLIFQTYVAGLTLHLRLKWNE